MAKQTRQQRRERRAQSGEQPTAQRTSRPVPVPAADGAGAGAPPRRPPVARGDRGRFSFFGESYGELKKVEWPGQSQVIQATVVVLIACIVVGVYLYLNDTLWKPVVQWMIGQ